MTLSEIKRRVRELKRIAEHGGFKRYYALRLSQLTL